MKCHFEKWVFGMMNGSDGSTNVHTQTDKMLHDKMLTQPKQ